MHRSVLAWVVCVLAATGCGDSTDPVESQPPEDFSWPPDASVYLDERGILSVDCQTDEDCTMALGYYHARDRWVQMDIRRRFPTGRLTEVVNRPVIESLDLLDDLIDTALDSRALFSTRAGEPAEVAVLRSATPKTRALLDAYAVGVNQWLDDVRNQRNGAIWPREFQLPVLDYGPEDVPEWTPEDSIATVLALIEDLTNDESSYFAAESARQQVGDDTRFADLWSNEPIKKSSILEPGTYSLPPTAAFRQKRAPARDLALRERAAPVMQRLHERLTRTEDLRRFAFPQSGGGNESIGSNNWAVGPSIAAGEHALLCGDPHLGFAQPAIWYVAHLDSKTNGSGTIHTAGMTFAGLPWVIIGQNEDIAWGVTNSNLDFTDVYIEELVEDDDGDPIGVMFNGELVEFVRVDVSLEFSEGDPVDRELLFVEHHGAVRALDPDNDVAITLKWTGNAVDTDVNAMTELAVATNVEEARQALLNVTSLGQSWVVIDTEGSFGWFPYNRVPKRTWATDLSGTGVPWLPLPGTGEFEWDEFFAYEDLPQVVNRENGYLATANNDFTGALFDGNATNDGYPPLQNSAAAGYRHARIVDLIEATDAHTPQTMLDLIGDVYSLLGEDMTDPILELANDPQTSLTPVAEQVVSALASWNYHCPTGIEGTHPELSPLVDDAEELLESVGCAAFHVALVEIEAAIIDDEPHRGFPSFPAFFSIIDAAELNDGDTYWDDVGTDVVETRFDIVGAALDTAGSFLVDRLGNDETQWAWGRLHTMRLRSDLTALSSVFEQFNNPPAGEPLFANDGGQYTVDVANSGRDFVQSSGPSMRTCCEASSPVACTIQLAGGQSGHIDSPNYDDLLDLWLINQPVDLVFDISRARDEAREVVDY